MRGEILPIEFPELDERLYAGFWRRFGAFWLDFFIVAPVTFSLVYFNNLDRMNAIYTYLPSHVFFFIYHIYFVKRWGGTPGKLIAKIRIVKKDGSSVEWKEAILRHAVQWTLSIGGGIALLIPLLNMSDADFMSVGAIERMEFVMERAPSWHKPFYWMNHIWIWSEFVVLLSNKRKRALHDYVAGTVVIKNKYKTFAEQFAGEGRD